jgi:hypothetical protein
VKQRTKVGDIRQLQTRREEPVVPQSRRGGLCYNWNDYTTTFTVSYYFQTFSKWIFRTVVNERVKDNFVRRLMTVHCVVDVQCQDILSKKTAIWAEKIGGMRKSAFVRAAKRAAFRANRRKKNLSYHGPDGFVDSWTISYQDVRIPSTHFYRECFHEDVAKRYMRRLGLSVYVRNISVRSGCSYEMTMWTRKLTCMRDTSFCREKIRKQKIVQGFPFSCEGT